MNSDNTNYDIFLDIFEMLKNHDEKTLRSIHELIFNCVMKLEREKAIKASHYERSSNRVAYSNGFKNKTLNTRLGALKLNVPQVRGFDFYPQCIEKGCRSEKALKLAIAEMYLKGVSTRKVDRITEQLCGLNFSSTQVSRLAKELDEQFEKFRNRPLSSFNYVVFDATYIKVRRNGSVIDVATLIAYGVNSQGRREILGVSMSVSEAEVHWRGFMESLVKRGLSGVKLITSDNHLGLKEARKRVFPSVPWQRCQFHMSQNAQNYAVRKDQRKEIGQAMRDIFNASSYNIAVVLKEKICSDYEKKAPDFVRWLENNIEEGLTFFNFPRSHHKKIRTSNGLERVNKEIRRRTRVATLFPNIESALRLVTGVLVEIHEDWITGPTYLDMSENF